MQSPKADVWDMWENDAEFVHLGARIIPVDEGVRRVWCCDMSYMAPTCCLHATCVFALWRASVRDSFRGFQGSNCMLYRVRRAKPLLSLYKGHLQSSKQRITNRLQ
ncbi:unnamed protein product [Ectocarpus sp. 8 AP-2014]